MIEINSKDFLMMINNADNCDEVSRLRDMLESDEYCIDNHLELSGLLYKKEIEYNM